ncbi:MAG: hypothetical protein A2176_04630 [Spirochaetes bacterium RBG_13_51_14]|nr:MAG: hypothetical protein A2176_04630 [Spirochaetes bacterium RBG_13_51_14]
MKANILYHCKQPSKKIVLIVIVIALLSFWFIETGFAKEDKNIKLQNEEQSKGDGIIGKIRPEIGAQGSFVVPFGSPKPYLGYGYGCSLYADVSSYEKNMFSLRLGLTSGFMYFDKKKSNVSANLIILPEYAHVRFLIQFENGFRMYPKLGCGIGVAMLKKKEYKIINKNKLSYDLTAVGGVGIGYNPPAVKNLVVFAEGDYLMLFESVSGQFVTASCGVAYTF